MARPLMYADRKGVRVPTWTPHPSCLFECSYCYGPATYARFGRCDQCKAFTPHFHPERMKDKFTRGKTYFVESLGDPSFIPPAIFQRIVDHLAEYPETTFMIQSKNPCYFKEFDYTTNIWLGTTIETNNDELAQQYSQAPVPSERYRGLLETMDAHPALNYYLTFEPIMRCSIDEMLKFARSPNIAAVYVGRDNHENKLPEPSEEELIQLVSALTEALGEEKVHCKTLGPAWWEKQQKQ
jgi:hypothetical protein